MADTNQANKKKIPAKAKKNFVIFAALVICLFIAVPMMLFSDPDETKENQKKNAAQLSDVGQAQVDKANVDRTNTLTTIKDNSYQSQLLAAEDERRTSAKSTSTDSYMGDVATYNWEDVSPATQGDGDLNAQAIQGEPYKAIEVSEVSNNQYESRAQEKASEPPPRAQRAQLTPEQHRQLLERKRAAAASLFDALNGAPESKLYDYTESRQQQSQALGDQERPVSQSYAATNPALNNDSDTTTVSGVVPGDRFIGFTRTAINTDNTSWVEVEISSGPLKGAIVGMKPERVEGEVVLVSDTITQDRNTARFKAIALNPDVNLEPAFSTETNMRYLARFGAATASAVLTTVSEMIGRQQSVNVNADGYATQEVDFSKREIGIAAGAAGGAEISRMIAEEAAGIEPQVIVKSGHRVVLVVTEPQTISWMPEPFIINKQN